MPYLFSRARLLAGFCFGLLLSACASTPQADRLLEERRALEPQRLHLDVPFVAQTDDSCGPASLAMVLRDMGREGDVNALSLQTLVPGLGGTLQAEMLAAARRQGLLAYRVEPRLHTILLELQQQRPVIALVNLSFNWWPRWHYLVIKGYDLEDGTLNVHSGQKGDQHWSMRTFERLWARGGNWAFLMLEPGQWPVRVEEKSYVQAALDLERTAGLPKAAPAYRAALERWPDNLPALIGAGNAAYTAGDRTTALRHYRHAATLNAASATAANNLAQVLADLGHRDEALLWAQRAVERGGGDTARQTLDEIRAAGAASQR